MQGETGYPLAIICRVLGVARSTVYYSPKAPPIRHSDPVLTELIRTVINEHPTYGYRKVWAVLRFGRNVVVNRKTVHRIMRKNRWLVHQRPTRSKPRVKQSRSRTAQSNQRWAMDITHIDCGQDGWAHLAAVIDCADREVIGWRFAFRGRAREAEEALEDACIRRFGGRIPRSHSLTLRSDNGLVFMAKHFRQTVKRYGISQEYITPYTPEQNGMIERFFRSLKDECVYQHHFQSFEEARAAITQWIRYYNEQRPHQALAYRSPSQVSQALLRAA